MFTDEQKCPSSYNYLSRNRAEKNIILHLLLPHLVFQVNAVPKQVLHQVIFLQDTYKLVGFGKNRGYILLPLYQYLGGLENGMAVL
jgi:hypothetical protein